eukprot:5927456-Pyramimonas_sp.AAC.1
MIGVAWRRLGACVSSKLTPANCTDGPTICAALAWSSPAFGRQVSQISRTTRARLILKSCGSRSGPIKQNPNGCADGAS